MDYHVLTPISFLLRLLEVSTEFFMVSTLLKQKLKLRLFIPSVLIFSFIIELIRLIIPTSFSWIFTTLLSIPFLIFLLKSSWIKITLAYLCTLISVVILDFTTSFLLIGLFKLPTFNSVTESNTVYYWGSFILFSLLFIATLAIKYFSLSKVHISSIKNKSMILNTAITTILIVPNIFILSLYFDKQVIPVWIIFINIVSIIAMFLVSLYNTEKNIRLIRSEQRLEYQRDYSSTLQHLVDSLRAFKHDYENTLQTLSGYAQIDKFDKIKIMLSQVVKETKRFSNIDVLNPDLIKNPDIYAIVNAKYKNCIEGKIDIDFDIQDDLENINMEVFDLTRILGIFLDNAIYASAESQDKALTFAMSKKDYTASIKISNSYEGIIPSNEKIFEKGFSTKGTDRGLGLYEVKKVLDKYPKAKLITTHSDDLFTQELLIPIY